MQASALSVSSPGASRPGRRSTGALWGGGALQPASSRRTARFVAARAPLGLRADRRPMGAGNARRRPGSPNSTVQAVTRATVGRRGSGDTSGLRRATRPPRCVEARRRRPAGRGRPLPGRPDGHAGPGIAGVRDVPVDDRGGAHRRRHPGGLRRIGAGGQTVVGTRDSQLDSGRHPVGTRSRFPTPASRPPLHDPRPPTPDSPTPTPDSRFPIPDSR